MVVQNILILSVLITNVLSAPSSCIESCDSYIKQYQTQTSGSFQNHVGLSQSGSYLQGLDYSKPGTWSEHNDYNTDNGHGKVHEERGQYVEGPKTVRYYKRNNTYSHSTSYPNSEELLRLEHQNNKHDTYIPTQNSYDKLGNTESIAQQYKYNRMHNQQYTQSSHRQTKTQSERLEDLGEYSGGALQTTAQNAADLTTQISQEPHHINTQPGNWSTVDSYKTDGGHGRVFEEQGQYVSGDKNVRYYKRNYTSNYSSSDGTPIPETINTRVHDVQREIEKFHKEFEKEFSHISTTKTIGSSNIAQTHVNNHGLPTDSIYNINNNNYKDQNDGIISSATNHNEEQHTSVITNQHLPYRNPYQNSYGTNSYSTYEKHEGYAKKFQPISQLINPISGYTTNVLTTADSDYKKNIFSDSTSQQITGNSQTDILDEHQSKLVRNQMFLDNLKNSEQRQNRLIHSGTPGHTGQYKEYWTSRHIKEESIPQHSTDISHINQHNLQYNNNQYANTHNLHQGLQQSSNLHKFAENSFDNIRKTQLEKLVVGTHDISRGADVVDCASNSQHSYGSSQYQTRYKRNVNYDKQEKVEQQERKHFNDDFTQETLHTDYPTHQTSQIPKFQRNTEQSHQPWKPGSSNQRLEDLMQTTDGSDDITQQTAGNLEFDQESQQSYQPWKIGSANHRLEDLTQKTDESDDLTQQTFGNLEFGQESQQSYQPWKPESANHRLEDHKQTRDEFEDLTQQTTGNLEFGQESQQSYQPWKRGSQNQRLEHFMQTTDGSDDLTQQISGNLEFGQESQQSYQHWKPGSVNHRLEDLTQKTDGFDDLTQQTAGNLEFGQESQQSYQPWKPGSANHRLEDLTQKTDGSDDLTQQTSGNLELEQESQQSYQPWKPESANHRLEDLTQKTDGSDDLTQQTSGTLEFGQESQQFYKPWKLESANHRLDDLTQKTDGPDDLTQQTSGNLELEQESQQSYQPWTPGSANHRLDGLTQKTDGTDDLTQQTSGNLELEQESQQSYQPWTPGSANHRLDDLTQKTDGLDDLTQQTSGNLEFGQESQQSYQPWKPGSANHQLEDLTQKTDGSDDLTQQTAGNLEFGQESQQSYQPWKPGSANHRLDDLTQKTDGSDDLTQKTAGNLEFGQEMQQSYQPWKPGSANHRLGDLTQKTDGFDDLTQQTSENLEFGQNSQQSYQTWKPGSANQELGDITDHELASHSVKPAVKPKPRSRYSRFGPSVNLEISNQNAHNIDKPSVMNFNGEDTIPDIYELPPEVGVETDTDNTHNTNAKEDQMRQNVRFRNLNQLTDSTGYDIVGGNVDQVSLLHKSNDATVGLQWHYTYHPSDQRQFVQQTDQKNKEGLQQESKIQFSDLEQNLNQEIQNKYTVYKPHRQLELPKQSQNYAFESEINPIKRTFNYDQTKNKLIIDQQLGENEEKYVATVESEPKPIPRILETYGGGQYDPTIDDSIYSKVTINPSATLSSTNDMDSWDIREKLEVTTTTTELTPPPLPVQPLDINDTTETPQSSSFWSRVGNKITTTFGKAKEKARHIFG